MQKVDNSSFLSKLWNKYLIITILVVIIGGGIICYFIKPDKINREKEHHGDIEEVEYE